MILNKIEALKLWQNEMGNKEYAYDFSGKKIKCTDYGIKNQVGWVATYLRPLEIGGTDNAGNIIIMHHRTFEDWNYQYPGFSVNEQKYVVHYEEKGDYYYVEKVLEEDDDEGGFFI